MLRKRMSVAMVWAFVLAMGSVGLAAPILDGHFDPSEGYTSVKYVSLYTDKGVKLMDPYNPGQPLLAQLWTYCDPGTKDLYIAFVEPLAINDNTYGTNTASDWPNRKGDDHTFDNLVGSDKARFQVYSSTGTLIVDFDFDYITKTGAKYTSGPNVGKDIYASLGVTGGDGRINNRGVFVSDAAAKAAITGSTSLSYNFNTLGYYLTTNSPQIVNSTPPAQPDYTLTGTGTAYTGWDFTITYEVKIAGSAFGAAGCGNVFVPTVHNSPAKLGTNATYFQETSGLGDFVWHDLNANGIQDPDEPGIEGVTVNLLDGSGNPTGKTTTTDEGGYYLFPGLNAGNYIVQFVKPAGYDSFSPRDQGANDAVDSDSNTAIGTTTVITLAQGQMDLRWDAGLFNYASLGDYVWHDLNANGIQDAGETGIAGVTVNLLDGSGNPTGQTTTTNASGYYLFSGLTPGNYSVQFVKPAGYDSFSPQDQGANDAVDSDANTSTGKTVATNLISGQNDLTWDAGLFKYASLGDYVWHDLNANGIQDAGETGIAGVTVNLLDGSGNPTGQTTTTNASGYYLFSGLTPGNYSVQFVKPVGYDSFSPQDQGANDAVDSDANTSTGKTVATTLISGQSDLTWDAGLFKYASLGDYVWHDLNANGIQEAGEPGVEGVTVNLLDGSGNPTGLTTITNASGYYLFTGLVPGSYSVEFIKPANYNLFSPQNASGDPATDSDADPATGKTVATTLISGQTDLTWDAGLFQFAALGDRVWYDLNKNGIQDPGEPGAPGVTVNLLDSAGGLMSSMLTGSGGYYLFADLLPGQYEVQFILPSGYVFSPADVGLDDLIDSDANIWTGRTGLISLFSGQTDLSWDAGIVRTDDENIPEPFAGTILLGGIGMLLARRRRRS